MANFRLRLEALDARIVPDATPITPPTLPPAQIGIDPQVWQQLIEAAKKAYLDALTKLEADVVACDNQETAYQGVIAGLAAAKADLVAAAAADKPAKQEMVDLWQALVDNAKEKLEELVFKYRDDRNAAILLRQRLLTMAPNEVVPSFNDTKYVLGAEIDSLVPQRIIPNDAIIY